MISYALIGAQKEKQTALRFLHAPVKVAGREEHGSIVEVELLFHLRYRDTTEQY